MEKVLQLSIVSSSRRNRETRFRVGKTSFSALDAKYTITGFCFSHPVYTSKWNRKNHKRKIYLNFYGIFTSYNLFIYFYYYVFYHTDLFKVSEGEVTCDPGLGSGVRGRGSGALETPTTFCWHWRRTLGLIFTQFNNLSFTSFVELRKITFKYVFSKLM
jgi:hypothetical protein